MMKLGRCIWNIQIRLACWKYRKIDTISGRVVGILFLLIELS